MQARVVADLAGISPGYLSMLEAGERALNKRSTLEAIANALRVAPSELGALPTDTVLNPEVAEALGTLPDLEAALTDVEPREATVTPRPLDAVVAELDYADAELRPRSKIVEQMQIAPRLVREANSLYDAEPGRRGEVLEAIGRTYKLANVSSLALGARSVASLAASAMRDVTAELGPEWAGAVAFARNSALSAGGRERVLARATKTLDGLDKSEDRQRQVAGMLHLQSGLAAATLADGEGAREHVGEARNLARPGDEFGALAIGFGPDNVDFWAMAVEIELGEPGRAMSIADRAIPERHPSWSRQSAFHLDRARAQSSEKKYRKPAVWSLVRAEMLHPVSTRTSVWARSVTGDLLRTVKRDSPEGRELRGLGYRMGIAPS
ncbi:hypothetical protein AFB00_23325 [Pseudonocardia sp. HH130630-07]|nr:hypothetical protein AFB00_23325 [Pseudonocardia sp. HH130630-07]